MSTTTHTHKPTPPVAPDDQRREAIDEYLSVRKAFQAHAAVFAATMVGICLVNLLTNLAAGITGQWSAWWSAWALLGWGLGIAVHGLTVRLARSGTKDIPYRIESSPRRTQ